MISWPLICFLTLFPTADSTIAVCIYYHLKNFSLAKINSAPIVYNGSHFVSQPYMNGRLLSGRITQKSSTWLVKRCSARKDAQERSRHEKNKNARGKGSSMVMWACGHTFAPPFAHMWPLLFTVARGSWPTRKIFLLGQARKFCSVGWDWGLPSSQKKNNHPWIIN